VQSKELSKLRAQLRTIPEAEYLLEALNEAIVSKEVIQEARQVISENSKTVKSSLREKADKREDRRVALEVAQDILGPDQFAETFDGELDDYYNRDNPDFVKRPEDIAQFKYIKNLKDALNKIKRTFTADLSEADQILLDAHLIIFDLPRINQQ